MTFLQGRYESKIDAKGRILLPSKFKAQLLPSGSDVAQELVLRKGFDKCVEVYADLDFKRIFSNVLELSVANEEARKLKRSFLAGTAQVEMDASGRFVIPSSFLESVEVEKESGIIMAGVGTHLEIWSSQNYESAVFSDSELSSRADKLINKA